MQWLNKFINIVYNKSGEAIEYEDETKLWTDLEEYAALCALNLTPFLIKQIEEIGNLKF